MLGNVNIIIEHESFPELKDGDEIFELPIEFEKI
jgi:hypothetical protein